MQSIQRKTEYPFLRYFDTKYEVMHDLYGQQQHRHVVQLFHRSLQSDHQMDADRSYHLRYGQTAYLSVQAHKQLLALHVS